MQRTRLETAASMPDIGCAKPETSTMRWRVFGNLEWQNRTVYGDISCNCVI